MALDFSPISLLREDLGSSERSSRLRGVRGLRSIAVAVGFEKTRDEVLPAIHEHISHEQDDEVLHKLASVLGDFLLEIGGPAYVTLLYTPLCDLARVEETIVHVRATMSLITVFDATNVDGAETSSTSDTVAASNVDLAIYVIQQLSGMNAACDTVFSHTGGTPTSTTVGLGAKMSAARLVAPVTRLLMRLKAGEDKLALIREMFHRLAFDEAPSVRRATASELGSIAMAVASEQSFVHDSADVVWSLVTDENDLVRVVALRTLGMQILACSDIADMWSDAMQESRYRDLSGSSNTVTQAKNPSVNTGDVDTDEATLARHKEANMNDAVLKDPAASISLAAGEDASWRVREALAQSFEGYLAHYCRSRSLNQIGAGQLLTIFSQLFIDREVEVRVAAYEAVNAVASVARNIFASHTQCIPYACRGADPGEHPTVRIAAAKALTQLLATMSPIWKNNAKSVALSEVCGGPPDGSAQRTIFSTLEIKVFTDDHVEVLLATLRELKDAVPFLVGDAAQRVAHLVESTEHDNWRVRRAFNSALPAVAAKRGRDAFESQLLEGYVRSFHDRICEVRQSAVDALAALRDLSMIGDSSNKPIFDADWLMEKIGKRLSELYLTMSYYVYRITIVQAFEKLAANSCLSDHNMEALVLFLSDAARDDVPNVRFTAVTALETAVSRANDRVVNNFIKPILNELLNSEPDPDVQLAVDKAFMVI